MFVLWYILCFLSIFDTGKICQGNSAELAVDDRRSKSTGDYLSLFEFQSIGLLGLLQFCDAVMNMKPVFQRFLQRLQWDLMSPSMFCHWDLVRSFGEETLPWEQGQAECRGRKVMENNWSCASCSVSGLLRVGRNIIITNMKCISLIFYKKTIARDWPNSCLHCTGCWTSQAEIFQSCLDEVREVHCFFQTLHVDFIHFELRRDILQSRLSQCHTVFFAGLGWSLVWKDLL